MGSESCLLARGNGLTMAPSGSLQRTKQTYYCTPVHTCTPTLTTHTYTHTAHTPCWIELTHTNKYVENKCRKFRFIKQGCSSGQQCPLELGNLLQRSPPIHSLCPQPGLLVDGRLRPQLFKLRDKPRPSTPPPVQWCPDLFEAVRSFFLFILVAEVPFLLCVPG